MKHDEQFLGQIEGVLIGAMDDREDALKHGKVITKACREYGEVVAAPLEARILALEEALGIAHEVAIKADRKERGRIGNVSGNELYAMFSNAPVEPHPLLAGPEVKT